MNKLIVLMSALILMSGIALAISSDGIDKVRVSDNLPEKVTSQIVSEEKITSIESSDEKPDVTLEDVDDTSEKPKESIIQDSVDDKPSITTSESINDETPVTRINLDITPITPIEPEELLGDLDGDGDVDDDDLQLLLDAWGPCTKIADCFADLDNDNNVGASDLLILLANWTGSNDENGDNGDNGNGEEETVNPSNPPGAWFTKYGWNGQECVKRDLVTKPGKTKHTSLENPNLRVFQVDEQNFAYRVINGSRAFAWEPNPLTGFGKRIREPTCDKTRIETDPLPVSWWRNSHNQTLYFQLSSQLTIRGGGGGGSTIVKPLP